EIWCMQPRFEKRRGKRALRLISERRFRAAYDFLLLRVLEEPELKELADWWTQIQDVEGDEREAMTRNADGPRKRRR
ncbi:polynucleotide adenylyltransferase PcnB, partial [Klebsiella pneumoniae]|nr:polynucleotide adenylyltransferase PcnB [Klebsiella pneumoniae]